MAIRKVWNALRFLKCSLTFLQFDYSISYEKQFNSFSGNFNLINLICNYATPLPHLRSDSLIRGLCVTFYKLDGRDFAKISALLPCQSNTDLCHGHRLLITTGKFNVFVLTKQNVVHYS